MRTKTPSPGGGAGPVSVDSPKFYSEPPTKQKNVTASIFQSLLSVFDEMNSEQRMEFVDFASRYASLDAAGRHDIFELIPLYQRLTGEERAALLALARSQIERRGR